MWIPLASSPSEVTVFDDSTRDSYMDCQCTLQIKSAYRMPRWTRSTVLHLPQAVITCVVELLRARRQYVADQSVYLDLALFDDAFELKRPGA